MTTLEYNDFFWLNQLLNAMQVKPESVYMAIAFAYWLEIESSCFIVTKKEATNKQTTHTKTFEFWKTFLSIPLRKTWYATQILCLLLD